jgi:outer membrane biosynthesis protein TonB
MVRIGRAQAVRLVLIACVVLGSGSVVAFSATDASAGALESVTGPDNAAVVPPVEEVTETVGPPVEEVTKTVSPPVQEVTKTVEPPAKAVTEKVTHPVQETVDPVQAPAKQAAETVASSPATAPVKAAAAAPVHAGTDPIESSLGSAGNGAGTVVRKVMATATRAAGASGRAASDPIAPHESARAGSASAAPDAGPGDDTFEVPSIDGSVRAPLGRVMAYVWPAIALTRPALAELVGRWERGALRLAFGTPSDQGGAGSGRGPVVAGVHASGGQLEPPSGRSLFAKIPSALGHAFTSNVPLPAMLFYLIVVLAIIAVFLAMLWDIGVLTRWRRGDW